MSSEQRPLDHLGGSLGSMVLVGLKDGREIRGRLASYDTHVNLTLEEAEEVRSENVSKRYGKMVIRGDNVVFVSPAK